ncbi:Cocaine esterase [Lobosporangium transversale]|nr:Cocaine esterase [Lobosporangium transversale]
MSQPSDTTQIHIANQGVIQGALDPNKDVVRFLNVPFGVVQERWRPAVKPEPWTGVRDATKLGPVCPQPKGEVRFSRVINSYSLIDFDDETTKFDEKNCLNLNVFVHEDTLKKEVTEAAQAKGKGVAVIVYIHGGGFSDGANVMELYDGSNLVRQATKLGRPVIVVVPNYRLNFHGFFSCPELIADIESDPNLKTDYERATGNWGLQDQRLAFEWVHNNIAAFGGDPSNITAMGQSAGAISINCHTLTPQHHGLFHRAIMHSGAMTTLAAIRPHVEGKIYFDYLVNHFNIPKELSGKEKLELLKKVPGKELGQIASSAKIRMFAPYVDGVMIPEDVRLRIHKTDMFDQGVRAVMIGATLHEMIMFVSALGVETVEGLPRLYEKFCPPDETSRQLWEKVYGKPKTDSDAKRMCARVLQDYHFTFPTFSILRALSKRKDLDRSSQPSTQPLREGSKEGEERFKLFQYYFERSIEAVDAVGRGWGAHHGLDLVYVFGPDYALEKVLNEDEKRFMERVQTMWIQFAYGETTGTKTKDGVDLFPARITHPLDDYKHHSTAKEAIVLTPQCTVEAEHVAREGKDVMELWERSEKWVYETHGKNDSVKALRVGFLGIAAPGEKEWS